MESESSDDMFELTQLVDAHRHGKLVTHLNNRCNRRIRMAWPTNRYIVLQSLEKSEAVIGDVNFFINKILEMLCCQDDLYIVGVVKHIEDCFPVGEDKFIVLLGNNATFYAAEVICGSANRAFLLAKGVTDLIKIGLANFDVIYEEIDIPYIVTMDSVLRNLIESMSNIWKFHKVLSTCKSQMYQLCYTDRPPETLMLFLKKKTEFPKKIEWDRLHEAFRDLPEHGVLIGTVGSSKAYARNVLIMMDVDGIIYGATAENMHCVRIADSFSMFLKIGLKRLYKQYAFYDGTVYGNMLRNILPPACPH